MRCFGVRRRRLGIYWRVFRTILRYVFVFHYSSKFLWPLVAYLPGCAFFFLRRLTFRWN